MPATAHTQSDQSSPTTTAEQAALTISVGIGEIRSRSQASDFWVVPGHIATTLRITPSSTNQEPKYKTFKLQLFGKNNQKLVESTLDAENIRLSEKGEIQLGHAEIGLKKYLTVRNSPFCLELSITRDDNSTITAKTFFRIEIAYIELLLGAAEDIVYPEPPVTTATSETLADTGENRKLAYLRWHNERYAKRNAALINNLRATLSNNSPESTQTSTPIRIKEYFSSISKILLRLEGNCFMLGLGDMYDNTGFRSYHDLWTYKDTLAGPWKSGPRIPLIAQPQLVCSSLSNTTFPDAAAVQGLSLRWQWNGEAQLAIDENEPKAITEALTCAYSRPTSPKKREGDTPTEFGGQRGRCPLMKYVLKPNDAVPVNSNGMNFIANLSRTLSNASQLVQIDITDQPNAGKTELDHEGLSRVVLFAPIISKDTIKLSLTPFSDQLFIPRDSNYCFTTIRTVTVHKRIVRKANGFYRQRWDANSQNELGLLFAKAGIALQVAKDYKTEFDHTFMYSYLAVLDKFLSPDGPLKYPDILKLKSDSTPIFADPACAPNIPANVSQKYRQSVRRTQTRTNTLCLLFEDQNTYIAKVAKYRGVEIDSMEMLDITEKYRHREQTYISECDKTVDTFDAMVAAEYLGRLYAADPDTASGLYVISYDFAHNFAHRMLSLGVGIASGKATPPRECPACKASTNQYRDDLAHLPVHQICDCGFELRNLASITLTIPDKLFAFPDTPTSINNQLVQVDLGNYVAEHVRQQDTMAETIAHEFGHSLFLPHAPFPAEGEEAPQGADLTMHQPDNSLCLMSYTDAENTSVREKHFCAICALRLRGWSGGEEIDKDEGALEIEQTEFRGHDSCLDPVRHTRAERNLSYSTGTLMGFNQPPAHLKGVGNDIN